jgi:hypothetical protein
MREAAIQLNKVLQLDFGYFIFALGDFAPRFTRVQLSAPPWISAVDVESIASGVAAMIARSMEAR